MRTKQTFMYGFLAVVLAFTALSLTGCPEPEPEHIHDWGAWDITAATCIATGSQTRTCKLDTTHTETEIIPIDLVNGHDWGEWEGTVTCTTAGTGTRTCSRSPTTHTETDNSLQPLGHAYNDEDWEETESPTCSKKGKEEANCVRFAACGNTGTREIAIDPDAHDYQISSGTAPTCTEDGNGVEICSYNQEHILSGVLPKLGHDYQNYTTTTDPTCEVDGEETGTCTHDQNHKDKRPLTKLGHDYQNWTQTTVPTCTTEGVETGTCIRDQVTTTRPKAIDPTAHDWNNEKEVIADATETTDGIKATTCKYNKAHTKDGEFSGEYATGTAGLDFMAIGNPVNAYQVYNKNSSNGTATGAIHIPAYHRPNASSTYLPVTEISYDNFYNRNAFGGTGANDPNTTLTSITFAAESQLTTIKDHAFYYCENLTSITIPASVTVIGNTAFGGCTSLTNITFPEGLTTIEESAFYSCKSFTEITLPEGITSIRGSIFTGCSNLTKITVSPNLTNISGTFENVYDAPSYTSNLDNLVLFICPAVTPPTIQGFSRQPFPPDEDEEPEIIYSTFDYTPNVQIKVPADSVAAYKTAPGWSKYADKISAIE